MLREAYIQQERFLRPFQGITQILLASQEKRMEAIQKQLAEIQKRLPPAPSR